MFFSIITPVYNRCDVVKRCVDSVLIQSFNDWEMILVDDGSTDKTPQIIDSTSKSDSRIRVFHFKHNKGTNAARNKAIAEARGTYCIILDSDDHLAPGALDFIFQTINNNRDFHQFLFAVNDRSAYYTTILPQNAQKMVFQYRDWLCGRIEGDFSHVIETDLLKKHRFEEEKRIYEFKTFWEIYKDSSKQLFVNDVTINRERNRSDSVTKESCFFEQNSLLIKKQLYEELIKEFMNDFYLFHLENRLGEFLKRLCFINLLLGNYSDYDFRRKEFVELNMNVPITYTLLRMLHLGKLFYSFVKKYSYIRYRIRIKR